MRRFIVLSPDGSLLRESDEVDAPVEALLATGAVIACRVDSVSMARTLHWLVVEHQERLEAAIARRAWKEQRGRKILAVTSVAKRVPSIRRRSITACRSRREGPIRRRIGCWPATPAIRRRAESPWSNSSSRSVRPGRSRSWRQPRKRYDGSNCRRPATRSRPSPAGGLFLKGFSMTLPVGDIQKTLGELDGLFAQVDGDNYEFRDDTPEGREFAARITAERTALQAKIDVKFQELRALTKDWCRRRGKNVASNTQSCRRSLDAGSGMWPTAHDYGRASLDMPREPKWTNETTKRVAHGLFMAMRPRGR